ncbi:craniofacial development protein 2-like [Artemia franciscana]|uniref:craniofacial development protein 2-like n=1 Tax=Artemia franciscana TaxID=6661 RepID=UPI0032DA1CD2
MLSNVVAKAHRHDIVTLCGDFNAKVGSDASYAPAIFGKHGLGELNYNGVYLIEFCATHELIVGASWFPHKQIRKYTWNLPDGVTRNEIDHILIAKHRRRCLEDVRTFRCANYYSDHQLVVAKFKLKLKTVIRPRRSVKRFNVRKL